MQEMQRRFNDLVRDSNNIQQLVQQHRQNLDSFGRDFRTLGQLLPSGESHTAVESTTPLELQLPDFEASEGVGILVPSTLITPSLGPTTASLRRTSSSLRSPTASKNVRRRYNPMAAASPASRRDDSAEATT
ncbi:hypothetical protein BGZ80_005161, partial [Entomortierella chlamydospora]